MDKIVFRVDSSLQIGSGHLMRCLTLAGRWRQEKDAAVYFIMRELDGNLINLVEKANFNVFKLSVMQFDVKNPLHGYEKWLTVKQEIDAEQTIRILKSIGNVARIVVDNYAIDNVWEEKIRPYVTEIMVIDDLANRRHDCDILLDQNFYLDKDIRYNGLVPKHCKLLLGPEYAILRDEFYEAKQKLRKRDGSIKNILVFFGGSDITNETMKALRAIEMLSTKKFAVDVIVGNSNPHKAEVEEFCKNHTYMNYYCQVDNMAEFMSRADLAIGAGGTTTWERLYLELPSIVIAIAENQVRGCEACAKVGYIDYLGFARCVSRKTIKNMILLKINE